MQISRVFIVMSVHYGAVADNHISTTLHRRFNFLCFDQHIVYFPYIADKAQCPLVAAYQNLIRNFED